MAWIQIGEVQRFEIGTATELVVADKILAVCNVGGEVFVMDGLCPHQGGPLGKGVLSGCVLTCPWHGLQFDVRDGQSQLTTSTHQATIKTKVEDGHVFLWIED